MLSRQGGRPAWLPVQPVWAPLVVVGLILLTGAQLEARETVGGRYRVWFVLPFPPHWFDDPLRAGVGVAVLVVGLAAFGLAQWRPGHHVALGGTRYAGFTVASLLFLVLAALTMWRLTGHATNIAPGGLTWGFIASTRGHPLDQAVAWTSIALAALLYVASYGGRSGGHRRPRAPAPEADAQ